MVILGMLLITAAGVVTLGTVLANLGGAHLLDDDFAILGYHLEASAGELFGYGVLTGLLAALGLYLVVVGAIRSGRQRAAARRALDQARRQQESLQQQRDRLAARLDHERGEGSGVRERVVGAEPTGAASSMKEAGPAAPDSTSPERPAAIDTETPEDRQVPAPPVRASSTAGRADAEGQPAGPSKTPN